MADQTNHSLCFNSFVCGNDLIVAGLHNYHHYNDCKLMDTYSCRDIINDIITLNVAKVCWSYFLNFFDEAELFKM
jgi:hypothetical protein